MSTDSLAYPTTPSNGSRSGHGEKDERHTQSESAHLYIDQEGESERARERKRGMSGEEASHPSEMTEDER